MWFKQKRMCSWSSVTIIASIVTLVSVVHLFLYPVVPSLDYFRQYKNSCIPINSTKSTQPTHNNIIISNQTKFPLDLHNGVVYRGAPWKNQVGQWLAGCDSITSPLKVIEVCVCT
uniref:Exostosin family protein n=1 Tax=Solanum tuberosum TaxID=4113 RepID=M1BR40_SOLTU